MAKKFKATVKIGNDATSMVGYCVDEATSAQLKAAIEAMSKGVVTEIFYAGADDVFTTAIPSAVSTDTRSAIFMAKDTATNTTTYFTVPYVEGIPTEAEGNAFATLISTKKDTDQLPDGILFNRMK